MSRCINNEHTHTVMHNDIVNPKFIPEHGVLRQFTQHRTLSQIMLTERAGAPSESIADKVLPNIPSGNYIKYEQVGA